MRARRRVGVVVLITVGLLTGLLTGSAAYAEDDPQPTEWPTVDTPANSGKSDPEPVDWPRPEQF